MADREGAGRRDGGGARDVLDGGTLVVLAALGLLALWPLLSVGSTTLDDLTYALPDRPWFRAALGTARSEGRFFFPFFTLLGRVPRLVPSFAFFKAASLAFLAADLALFGLWVRRLGRSAPLALLAVVLAVAGLQDGWRHSPVAAYPCVFTGALALLFGAFLAFDVQLRDGSRRARVAAACGFFLACCVYETFLLSLAVFLVLAWPARDAGAPSVRLRAALGRLSGLLAAAGTYLLLYSSFRVLFPSRSSHTSGLVLSLPDAARVWWRFTSSSVFASGLWLDRALLDEWSGSPDGRLHLLAGARVEWLVAALLAGWLAWRALGTAKASPGPPAGRVALVALALYAFPPVLHAFVGVYQEWTAGGEVSYVPTTFSFFGVALGAALGLVACQRALAGRPLLARAWRGGAALLVGAIAYLTGGVNHQVAASQARSRDTWRIVDRFLATDEFRALPPGSVIRAPTLWTRPNDYMVLPDAYWSRHASGTTGKAVRIEKEPERAGYSLDLVRDRTGSDQVLVFAALKPSPGTGEPGRPVADRAVLFSSTASRRLLVAGVTAVPLGPEARVDGQPVERTSASSFRTVVDRRGRGDLVRTLLDVPGLDVSSLVVSSLLPATAGEVPWR